ncbi:MAG: phage tail length tape measure family protein [Bradyrhizobium sp.]|uniref:phage tail length tape measure family protein n=1 Tax=Bradyrhizobium sp. TaxID=376 RepID=UPI0029A5D83D|nr:phage tail length tape measure family protein [Bradyrhizobium sp.]MDX3971172.1 phage tail length tape measure family protein [Bradyrhizobium sp.]
MANAQEAVRRLTIQTSAPGTSEATAELNALAQAQRGVTVASETTERATLNLDRSFASIERRYVTQVKAQQDLERVQRQVNAAVALNPALQERANAVLAAAEARYNALTKAANDNAAALERQAAEAARAAAVQANVNAVTGVSGGSNSAARAADVVAYGKALDDLKAKYNPLFAAGQSYKATLAEINQALKVGAITEAERAAAIMDTKVAFVQQVNSIRGVRDATDVTTAATSKFTAGAGLARHELINLGRQVQDVVVSLQGGQGLGTVMLQQGSQIVDVFASSRASIGDFAKQATGFFSRFLSAGRLAFGGVAVAITGAGLALNSYLDSQQKVQMSLLGAGRASGASVSSINATAQAGSSVTGLSVAEARAFAAELASTGKIGQDNLLPLVKIGHDIATVFGVDAVEAAKLLGRAFSDPEKGAAQLNERLGFLDAAMQRQIQNLVAQNRLQEAQRVLQAGVESSLVGVGEAVSTTTRFWTALGNAASNAWDKIGEGLSRATGIGLKLGLDEQLATAQKRLESFKKDLELAQEYAATLGKDAPSVDTGYDKAIQGVKIYQAEVDRLTEAMRRNSQATGDAVERQQSFAQAAGIRAQLPEIDQIAKLRNEQELLVKTLIDVQVSGGPASDILKRIGLSYEELAKAVAVANGNLSTFKTEFQSQSASLKIANDALTAFSPSARGDIARRQSLESTSGSRMDPAEKAALAQQAYDNAVKSVNVSLTEQARARALSSRQTVESAQLEIDLIGKTIGQQAELRANLQARQQLEQQASQNRTAFDDAEYERLKKINAELGKRTQAAALASVNDNISFGRQTALLSPEDVSIAQQLRGIYPDVATALDSTEAAAIRVNNAIKDSRDAGIDFTKTFFQGLLQGKSIMDSLADSVQQLASKLADKAITDIFSGNFIQGGIEGIAAIGLSLFGGDGEAKKELEQAKQQWASMADQVKKFNEAAAGVNLGALTDKLQQLISTAGELSVAAGKAQDYAAQVKIADTLHKGYETIVVDFEKQGLVQTDLQKAIEGVNDEANGLKATFADIGISEYAARIDAAAAAQIKALIAQYTDALTSGLQERLNIANGKSYLNDAAALLEQRQTDLANAADLGNDPAVLAQISAVFQAEAQAIIQNAGLVGDEFQEFMKLFPDLAGVVHEATVDVTESIKTISQYLESLQVGSNSILSPQDQLAAAQNQFSQQLALAQGGNADAIGTITNYASTLLDQAKSFYGSSEGYAGIYEAVSSALAALIGATPSMTASSSASSPTIAASTASTSALAPQLSDVLTSGSSTDVGSYFTTQTQTLVQALGSSTLSQIQAMNDNGDKIAARLDRLIATMEARSRGVRPSAKAAGG